MGLLAPWFLAGALAVGVPLYLHLLRRHTSTPQQFSSLMFVEPRTQSSIRHRRLRYLVLLTLRLLVLLLLVLAFANPYIKRATVSASGEKLLVIAVDNSLSMRAGSRLDDAKREAVSLLASRSPAQRAQVLAFGSQVQVMTQPIIDPAGLRNAVESIQPGDSRGSYGALAGALRSIAQSVQTPIELHVFSDMQRTNMPSSFSEMAMPANVSLVLHPVAKDAVANWTVESVNAPAQVWDPKKARVEAVVAGFGTAAATRTVSLVINGKTVATKQASVPANGRASVEFDSLDVPYGFSRCAVKIDSADAMPADDQYMFSVRRSDPQRVLFIHEANDSRSPLYFGAALGSSAQSAFVMETVPGSQVQGTDPTKYAFVVISDSSLPEGAQNVLMRYVRAGGNLLIATGTTMARLSTVPVFGNSITGSHYYSRDGAGFASVSDTDTSYAPVGKADQWGGVKFYYAVAIDPTGAHVIAHLTDQTPLVLEKQIGEGRVIVFASGFDNLTNDLPLHPMFVPFIQETAGDLSGLQQREGMALVDSYMQLRTAKEQAVSVDVTDPEGKHPLSIQQAATAQSIQLTDAGFYELRLANGRQDMVGVNADRRESDLAPMADDVMSLWTGKSPSGTQSAASGGSSADDSAPEKTPYSIAWYVLLALAAAALAESVLASRYLGTQREEP
ncbi:MAG TPA: BatA domain-containing protein [Candidatus Acidoferrales bacterium]|nr:BatA domain-containing protein [Candidatus Acidoferrales bacterium]